MPSVWTHWAIVLASALFAAAVEGAIVVVCVALVLNFFPRIPASVRSLLWFSVFGLLLILPVLSGLHGSASRVATGVHTLRIGSAWAFALVGIWSGMVLLRVVELVRSAALLHGIWRRAEPLGAMQSAVTMHVWASDEVRVPSVIGFFAPRIVIPKALIGHLGEEELRAIVLHEAEHLRRRDDWTNLIQKIGIAIFPIHPALLWVERQLCREREVACDDGVLRITGAPRVYAATLANLAEFSLFRRHLSLALGAWGRRPELLERVERILSRPAREMSRRSSQAILAGLVLGACVCTVELARAPQLVSFDGGIPVVVARRGYADGPRAVGLPSSYRFQQASFHVPAGASATREEFHMVETKALTAMPAKPAARGHAMAVSHALLHRVLQRRVRPGFGHPEHEREAGVSREQSGPYLILTSWNADRRTSMDGTAQPGDGTLVPVMPQTVVTSRAAESRIYANFAFTYAAVPVQGGWIIVQL
jgi:hypothetical protein